MRGRRWDEEGLCDRWDLCGGAGGCVSGGLGDFPIETRNAAALDGRSEFHRPEHGSLCVGNLDVVNMASGIVRRDVVFGDWLERT